MKEKIILIGGGGHCKSVIDVIESIGSFDIFGIVDKREKIGEKVLGYQFIGSDEDLPQIFCEIKKAVLTVGFIKDNSARIKIYKYCKEIGFELPNIISPLAYVSKHAVLGEGNTIMHFAIINTGAKIGNNCIINTKALIEHDAIVEDHCHISTAAVVNGGARIKEGTFFGSNAVSKEYIEVSGFIKAGSVVK
ncbi:MAG: NeuD/PglB/VioB family sugar acetyltransferase [Spirochaetota bacterium]